MVLFGGAYAFGYFSASKGIKANEKALDVTTKANEKALNVITEALDAVKTTTAKTIDSKEAEIGRLKDALTKWEAEKLVALSRAQAVVGNRVLLESGLASKFAGTPYSNMTDRLSEFMKVLFKSTVPIMTSPPSPGVPIPTYDLSDASKLLLAELNTVGLHISEKDFAKGLHQNIIMHKYSQPHHYGGITPIKTVGSSTGIFIGGDDQVDAKQLAMMMLHLQSTGNLPFELELLCDEVRLCRLVGGSVEKI
jgi:hypothetical protein